MCKVDTNDWEDPDVTNFGVGTLHMVKENQYYHTLWHSPKCFFSINRKVRKFVFHYFSNRIFVIVYVNCSIRFTVFVVERANSEDIITV